MQRLAVHDPWWIEEPTSPDDVLGHARIRREVAPIRVATGEHIQNRVIFKQLFQAEAIDVCQLDACRIGGVNEAIAVLLLAAKFGIPVCPHAGGVGLCEYVQHLAFFDYIAVSGSLENRVVEWVDHLHEHFRDPAVVTDGRYRAPQAPGYSIEMLPSVPRRVRVSGRTRLVRIRSCDRRAMTPVFLTSRNIGNVFSQTSVIAVVALSQLLMIVTRGIDLSVGSTIAWSGVTGR